MSMASSSSSKKFTTRTLFLLICSLVIIGSPVYIYLYFEKIPRLNSHAATIQPNPILNEQYRIFKIDTVHANSTSPADSLSNDSTDEPRNAEWEQLNKHMFFRRTAAFYVHDKHLLRAYYLTRVGTNPNLTYTLNLIVQMDAGKRHYAIGTKHVKMKKHWLDFGAYLFASLNWEGLDLIAELNTNFNLRLSDDDLFSAKSSMKIGLLVRDEQANLTTHHPIDVQLKRQRNTEKSGSVLCTFCYFYGDSQTRDNYLQFLWWIEANKRFGYTKLVLCNNSFPDTGDYRRLFAKHADFVQVYQMNYYPNYEFNQTTLRDDQHDYLRQFNQVHWYTTIMFEVLMYNECYMRNMDVYKHISVQGADELIIPRTNRKLLRDADNFELISGLELSNVNDKHALNKLLDIEAHCPVLGTSQTSLAAPDIEAPVDSYLSRLEKVKNTKQPFHFRMATYLRDVSVDLILGEFERYLASETFRRLEQANQPHLIRLNDSSFKDYEYNFVLKTRKDVNYARNIVKVYRLLVGEFKKTNAKALAKLSSNQYDRFVYLAGSLTGFACGKSIYNTDLTMSVQVHYEHESEAGLYFLDFDDGVFSHFRGEYSLKKDKVSTNMTVDELKFDLNYLYCYYRDMLNSLQSIDIIKQ